MASVVDQSLATLSKSDIKAVVTYLRSIPPVRSEHLPVARMEAAADFPEPAGSAAPSKGIRIFEEACASCHSWSGISPVTHLRPSRVAVRSTIRPVQMSHRSS